MIEFDPRDTLKAVVEQGRQEGGSAGVEVTSWVDPSVPNGLVGDESRLRKALHLLVGHAVASTEKGTVHARVRVDQSTPEGVRIRFEVTDRAPGLLARGDSGFPVTGELTRQGKVDLALWKQMVQLLAEELGVKSRVAGGNTIWFTVDFAVRGGVREGAPEREAARPCHVLVVEDNLVNQKVAVRMIEKLGHSVKVVADGLEAVAALDKESFDLILMDCQMPVMDGYEATVEIRKREEGRKRTPIVALTAHAVESNRKRCLEIGMDDFVTKPVTTDQLRRVLEDWLSPSGAPLG
jgi:CheY-like chemotaxis protein